MSGRSEVDMLMEALDTAYARYRTTVAGGWHVLADQAWKEIRRIRRALRRTL